MLLTFNVSAAGEFVQYIAPGSREPVLAHEIVESQNLPRKPPRGKARQPLRYGLEAPQAIEFECCQDLFSVSPGEQGQIIVHRTSRTYNHPIPQPQYSLAVRAPVNSEPLSNDCFLTQSFGSTPTYLIVSRSCAVASKDAPRLRAP